MKNRATFRDMLNRRELLREGGLFGLSPLALAWLLQRDGLLASPAKPIADAIHQDLEPRLPPLEPKATAMISLFMHCLLYTSPSPRD